MSTQARPTAIADTHHPPGGARLGVRLQRSPTSRSRWEPWTTAFPPTGSSGWTTCCGPAPSSTSRASTSGCRTSS